MSRRHTTRTTLSGLAIYAVAMSACSTERSPDDGLLVAAGSLASALSEELAGDQLGGRSHQELLAVIADAAEREAAGYTVDPVETFPYLITVSSDTSVCVAPDFNAIAQKRPGPLEFEVTAGACVLESFEDGFAAILEART